MFAWFIDHFSRCPWSPTFLNRNIIFLRDFSSHIMTSFSKRTQTMKQLMSTNYREKYFTFIVLSFLPCVFPFPPLLRQNLRFNKSHTCSSSKPIKSSARPDGKVQQHQARRKLAPMRLVGGGGPLMVDDTLLSLAP